MVINLVRREIYHFFALSAKAQKLLVSYFLIGLSFPIISTFVNAYIFLNQGSFYHLLVFNVGHFIIIPAVFYLNGLLLNRIKITHLYFFGALLIGLSPLLVVFYTSFNLINYFFYGLVMGVGSGFYWANRTYFTLKETDDHNRNYFLGVNFSNDTLSSVVVSFATGWLLVFGLTYQYVMIFAFILIFASSFIILISGYVSPKVSRLVIVKPTDRWKRMKKLQLSIGVSEGIGFFFPSFLILSTIGNEGILGTLSSVTAVLSALLIYFYGRKATLSHRKPVFFVTIVFGILSSVLFALFFDKFSTIIYVLGAGLIINFMWLTAGPAIMNAIDNEVGKKEENRYSYIYEGELFLNIGRTISFITCLLFFYFGQDFFLRFLPMVLYGIQGLILLWTFKKSVIIL